MKEPTEQFQDDMSKGMESVIREALANNTTPATTERQLLAVACSLMLSMSIAMGKTLAGNNRQKLIYQKKKMMDELTSSFSRELLKTPTKKSDFKVIK